MTKAKNQGLTLIGASILAVGLMIVISGNYFMLGLDALLVAAIISEGWKVRR